MQIIAKISNYCFTALSLHNRATQLPETLEICLPGNSY